MLAKSLALTRSGRRCPSSGRRRFFVWPDPSLAGLKYIPTRADPRTEPPSPQGYLGGYLAEQRLRVSPFFAFSWSRGSEASILRALFGLISPESLTTTLSLIENVAIRTGGLCVNQR